MSDDIVAAIKARHERDAKRGRCYGDEAHADRDSLLAEIERLRAKLTTYVQGQITLLERADKLEMNNNSLRARVAELEAALALIANEHGQCKVCGKVSEVPGWVGCDEVPRACTWSPLKVAEFARALLPPAPARPAGAKGEG